MCNISLPVGGATVGVVVELLVWRCEFSFDEVSELTALSFFRCSLISFIKSVC